MNTLLGEITTLNDIQYPVYRVAFKFRKLQKAFLFDHIEVGTLQDALHQSGIQGLARSQPVPLTQLRSFITELYSSLKVQKPSLGASKLQQAQELLFSWCQMAYLTSTGGAIQAGYLKIFLSVLTGSKLFDKARVIFTVLASQTGTVEVSGISFFLEATQQIGDSIQENLYSKWSLDQIFHDCLAAVRSKEDMEDEEELEGIAKRPWLSQFEFTKMATATPAPSFLAWLALYHKQPSIEKEVHSVRCCDCTRKPIVAARYQCTVCPNYNLCQMCFLKGRTSDKHTESHQVLEFTTGGKAHKSWKQRLMGSKHSTGTPFQYAKEPFVYSPRTSRTSPPAGREQIDSPINSVTDMLSNTQQSVTRGLETGPKSHQPQMIRISSDEAPSRTGGQRPSSQLLIGRSAPKRNSLTSSGGSPDSSLSGGKFNFDGSMSGEVAWQHSSIGNLSTGSGSHASPTHEVVRRGSGASSAESAELSAINKRLSMEVDQLLNELPPPPPQSKLKLPPASLSKLQVEERALKGQVNQLSGQRKKLSGELSGLLTQLQRMQLEGSSSSLNRGFLETTHSRCDSAPMDMPLRVGSTSPPRLRNYIPDHSSTSHLHGSQHLLDPLVDFTPDQLKSFGRKDVISPENQRLSVAW